MNTRQCKWRLCCPESTTVPGLKSYSVTFYVVDHDTVLVEPYMWSLSGRKWVGKSIQVGGMHIQWSGSVRDVESARHIWKHLRLMGYEVDATDTRK